MPETLAALEVFGRDGTWHTADYSTRVSSLEIWEIDPTFERRLVRNFPEAVVKITDSFSEVLETDHRFDFIVIDNPTAVFGDGQFCEHFDLFPSIFRVALDSVILVVNVIPDVDERTRQTYPYIFDTEHLRRRSDFYGTATPTNIPVSSMLDVYCQLGLASGFELAWSFARTRHFVHYLVLKFEKVHRCADSDSENRES